MSAKKPWFKARIGYSSGGIEYITERNTVFDAYRVRVADARELTPEKAVERVLRKAFERNTLAYLDMLAREAGMTFDIVNGKVRVRKVKR